MMEKEALELLTNVCAIGTYEALKQAAWFVIIELTLFLGLGYVLGYYMGRTNHTREDQ